jgi:hypothetical protein
MTFCIVVLPSCCCIDFAAQNVRGGEKSIPLRHGDQMKFGVSAGVAFSAMGTGPPTARMFGWRVEKTLLRSADERENPSGMRKKNGSQIEPGLEIGYADVDGMEFGFGSGLQLEAEHRKNFGQAHDEQDTGLGKTDSPVNRHPGTTGHARLFRIIGGPVWS